MRGFSHPPSGRGAEKDRRRFESVVAAGRRFFLLLYLVALALGGQESGRTLLAVTALLCVQKLFEAACRHRWIVPHRAPPKGPLRLRRTLHGVDLEDEDESDRP